MFRLQIADINLNYFISYEIQIRLSNKKKELFLKKFIKNRKNDIIFSCFFSFYNLEKRIEMAKEWLFYEAIKCIDAISIKIMFYKNHIKLSNETEMQNIYKYQQTILNML